MLIKYFEGGNPIAYVTDCEFIRRPVLGRMAFGSIAEIDSETSDFGYHQLLMTTIHEYGHFFGASS